MRPKAVPSFWCLVNVTLRPTAIPAKAILTLRAAVSDPPSRALRSANPGFSVKEQPLEIERTEILATGVSGVNVRPCRTLTGYGLRVAGCELRACDLGPAADLGPREKCSAGRVPTTTAEEDGQQEAAGG